MTHFNTNLRLPVRTGPSPMEDAIVQQVEWYMGRLNLEKDEYLKDQMDDELWVSLDVILNFPKMQRLGVHDKRRVATLLHARSTIVEVDEKAARIRPAWARRSTIVIHDVPANARLDQIASLFQIPSNADLSNASVPPTVSHPPGLISIQPAAETIWLAIFDSPTGARDSMHLLLDKEINGQKVNPEVHVENPLRPLSDSYRQPSEAQPQQNVYQNPRSVDSQQPNSAPYAQVNQIMSGNMMTNQMLNPMGLPMPVMHHPTQDAHPQYTYGPPPATYAPGYPHQNMGVPRQFMGAPRGLHAGYVMTYPQAGHPYDPSHAVPMQPHPIRAQQQQQQVDQTGTPMLTATPISPEGATTSQGVQPVPSVPNGASPAPTPGETIDGAEASSEYVQDGGLSQVQADAQRIAAQIPYTTPVQMPVMSGQPIDGQMMMPGQVKTVDMHYLPRTPMMNDPNVYGRGSNGRQAGMGRDRNGQRSSDGGMRASGRGPMMDGQRGSAMHRKGKKGNRGNARHGHGHDRDRRDGKGDGSGSDSGNREDRRYEKSKQEPNLASMHFPPLPMSENSGARVAPPRIIKKDEAEDKALSSASTSETKEAVPNGNEEVPTTDDAMTEKPARVEGETATPTKDTSEKDSAAQETADPKERNANKDIDQAEKSMQDAGESKEESPAAEGDKKPEQKAPAPAAPASSPMSYAAILRSKKPGPPPRPAPPPVSRSSSGASGKNSDSTSGSEANPSVSHPPKEKSGRRRKSSGQRNSHTGDTKDGNSASTGSKNDKNDKNDKNADKHLSEPVPSGGSKDANPGSSDNIRSKPVVENTRAHPVWVNKPKSLFQAASATPTVRQSSAKVAVDSKKVTSPVSSQGDEKELHTEKGCKDVADCKTLSGQANGTVTSSAVTEERSEVNMNGTAEDKTDISDVATSKEMKTSPKAGGDGGKSSKGSKGPDKATNVSVKGAWAAGGPTWPKNNGNGVMEKTSNTTES